MSKHTRTNIMELDPGHVRSVMDEISRCVPKVLSQPSNDEPVFAALELIKKSKGVSTLMPDGESADHLDSYKRVSSMNDVQRIMGKLTWRDYITERLMWAFASGDTEMLRVRLIALMGLLIQWIVEIDLRLQAKRGGQA